MCKFVHKFSCVRFQCKKTFILNIDAQDCCCIWIDIKACKLALNRFGLILEDSNLIWRNCQRFPVPPFALFLSVIKLSTLTLSYYTLRHLLLLEEEMVNYTSLCPCELHIVPISVLCSWFWSFVWLVNCHAVCTVQAIMSVRIECLSQC